MDLMSGRPYWPLKNGLLATYPPLKRDASCEVAIIGGGITGALVAYHLTAAGVDTLVIDRRDIGWGSTSGSTALLQYEVDTHLHELKQAVGEAAAVRSYQLCLGAIGKIEQIVGELGAECDFERKLSVYLASRSRDVDALRREWEARRSAGIRVDFLSQAEVEQRFSFSRPAALLSYDAAQIDIYRLTHALMASVAARGARIYDRTAVERYERSGDGIELLTDRGCRVRARKVVFATGYEAPEHLKKSIVALKSTYALVSEPLESFDGWYERCLIWESARPYFYLRTTADGRAIIGGEDVPFKDALRRDRLIDRKTRKLREKFCKLFPAIELDVAYSWAGTFGETKDGLAYIGETKEFPDGYFALGYGGNGVTYSVIAAEIIRDLYLGRESDDAQIFRFDR